MTEPTKAPLTFDVPEGGARLPCRACPQLVVFVTTKAGRLMPVNADGDRKGEPHWATCPAAASFRKDRKR